MLEVLLLIVDSSRTLAELPRKGTAVLPRLILDWLKEALDGLRTDRVDVLHRTDVNLREVGR